VHPSLISWIVLGVVLAALLVVDLVILRKSGSASARSAGIATLVWTVIGLLATIPVALVSGGTDGSHYVTIYLLERALSLDNVAVFAIALAALKVAPERREGLVVAGVAAALVLRVTLIGGGLALVDALHAALYVFGALLVVTGLRTLRSGLPTGGEDDSAEQEAPGLTGRIANRLAGRSPTLVPLLVLAVADVVFAVDSIPAAFGISKNAFPIVAANGFAVLGLHAAYVLLESGLARFRHLDTGLGIVLLFIGAELLTEDVVHLPSWVTLVAVLGVLGGAIGLSLRPARDGGPEPDEKVEAAVSASSEA